LIVKKKWGSCTEAQSGGADFVCETPEVLYAYVSKCSAIVKEEAVSKAIYGNVLQMHSWSKENESLFSGTEVGIMLNKVMLTFVAATKAYKSTLVSG
jgi:hypothetical protein